MADNQTWVRFADQTDDQAIRVNVSRQGIVDDLRAEIAKAFPVRVLDRSLIDLKIGQTELTNNRQRLEELPQDQTVVVTVHSLLQPTQVEANVLQELARMRQELSGTKQELSSTKQELAGTKRKLEQEMNDLRSVDLAHSFDDMTFSSKSVNELKLISIGVKKPCQLRQNRKQQQQQRQQRQVVKSHMNQRMQ